MNTRAVRPAVILSQAATMSFACLIAMSTARADPSPASPADKTAIAACLASTKDKPEACIGKLYKTCTEQPDGMTTMGMNACASRETAVWDELLNTAYKSALGGDYANTEVGKMAADGNVRMIKGKEILRDTQRAWIVYRDAKCSAAQLPMAGGTGASLLAGDCLMQETARQALWLQALTRSE